LGADGDVATTPASTAIEADLRWVYENYGNEKALEAETSEEAGAPTTGAWALLKAAKADPKLYQEVVRRLVMHDFSKEEPKESDEVEMTEGMQIAMRQEFGQLWKVFRQKEPRCPHCHKYLLQP